MDGMVENGMAMGMSRLPYFDPFMLVNLSGTCACSRLLQIRFQGLLSVNLGQKLMKEIMKNLTGEGEWIPILYEWQLVESVARKPSDYGQLVFCDKAVKMFVIVKTCFCPCIHLKERAHNRAHLLFCLARYIGYNPTWVRFTIATKDDKKPTLPAKIFVDGAHNPGPWQRCFERHGFGQVDSSNLKAALGMETLKKMDIVINRSAPMAARVALDWAAAGGAAAVRAQVLQTAAADRGGCPPDQAAPPLPIGVEPLFCRSCASCGTSEEDARLLKCAGCEMKWYCSKKCQKAHWKLGHKIYCKHDPNRPAAEPLRENIHEQGTREGFIPVEMQVPGLNGTYIP